MPLLFHIAISDQNRELDAILHMSLDRQSAWRQRTQRIEHFHDVIIPVPHFAREITTDHEER